MKKAMLRLENVSKSFRGVAALSNINIEFYPGKVNALIGSNGAGKSTLINIITGNLPVSSGTIYVNDKEVHLNSPFDARKLGIAVCPQEIQVFPELTVLENIFMGNEAFVKKDKLNHTDKHDIAVKLLKKLSLDLIPAQKMKNLSLAEKFLIQFARTIVCHPRLIMMDELTDVLTQVESEIVYSIIEELKREQTAVIFITHKVEEALKIADDITILRDGRICQIVKPENTGDSQIETEILGQDKKGHFPRLAVKKGEELLRVEHISNRFLEDISFTLRRGEIIGVAGLVGSGRSSLLRAIVGLDKVEYGRVIITSEKQHSKSGTIHNNIGYMPENRDAQGLFSSLSIAENITMKNLKKISRCHIINGEKQMIESRDAMQSLGMKEEEFEKHILELSGGNKQKILVARNVFSKCNIYVFDEPTKGIDIAGKVEIYNIINELVRRGAGIILVSSDFSELAGMCDRLIIIRKGRMSAQFTQDEITQLRLYISCRDT